MLLPSIAGEVERCVNLSCFSGLEEVESKLIAVVQHNGDISLSKTCSFVICPIFCDTFCHRSDASVDGKNWGHDMIQ